MKTIFALDPGFTSTNPTGLVVLSFDPRPVYVDSRLLLPPEKPPSWEVAVDHIAAQIATYLQYHLIPFPPDAVAYEMPHSRVNIQTALKLAVLAGEIRRSAFARGPLPCVGVQPKQAKKALTTNGSATKRDMQRSAHVLLGVKLSAHEADAVGIGLAGAALLGWFDTL